MSLLQPLHRMDAEEDMAALSCICCCRVAPHKACHWKGRLMKSQPPRQQESRRGLETPRTSPADPAMQAARQASSSCMLVTRILITYES